jgi:hypothetical protein
MLARGTARVNTHLLFCPAKPGTRTKPPYKASQTQGASGGPPLVNPSLLSAFGSWLSENPKPKCKNYDTKPFYRFWASSMRAVLLASITKNLSLVLIEQRSAAFQVWVWGRQQTMNCLTSEDSVLGWGYPKLVWLRLYLTQTRTFITTWLCWPKAWHAYSSFGFAGQKHGTRIQGDTQSCQFW